MFELGVNPWEGDLEPKYTDSTTLASRVSRLNPAWNETSNEVTENSQFAKAMELCGAEFSEYVLNIALVLVIVSMFFLVN